MHKFVKKTTMSKNNILLCFLMTISFGVFAQKNWKVTPSFPANLRDLKPMTYVPSRYAGVELDFDKIAAELKDAPEEFSQNRGNYTTLLPMPNGEMVSFNVVSSPVMHPELSAKYPSIKSYKAWNNEKGYVARFDVSPYGLRAAISTNDGDVYIDPYFKGDTKYYVSYFTKYNTEPKDMLLPCGVNHDDTAQREYNYAQKNRKGTIDLHIYKFALSCTGEWGKVRGTAEKALADMNTATNRLNLIFEGQFASRMVLIAENDKLIHLDGAADPFTRPTLGGSCMGENTGIVNTILGNSNKYDLGHVFTVRCTDVGGVAQLGSICQSNKGAGCSCEDYEFAINVVQVTAHEIGHQLSASHTFNACTPDSQNAGDNGFEPGGGSTIMGYGGLCGSNNSVQRNDDYYHNGSLVQIFSHLRASDGGAFACAEKVPTENNAPVAEFLTPANTYIPISTAFVMDGKGQDADNDRLFYNIEEKDGSPVLCDLGKPEGACPMFRSIAPDTFPYRFFPNKNRILLNQNGIDEVLPTYTRDLNFSFTVRDKSPKGGYTDWALTKIKVDGNAGPFVVTAPNNGTAVEAGEMVDVTWDVANTNTGAINCKYVDIYVSRKSALHPSDKNLTLLASRVPNDGAERVQIYGQLGNDARILVRGYQNIFFDISNFKFSIVPASKPRAFVSVNKYFDKVCAPNFSSVTINSEALGGFTEKLNYSIGNLPAGLTHKFQKESTNAGEENILNFTIANELPTGTYRIPYYIISDSKDTITKEMEIQVVSTDFSSLASLTPLNGDKNSELPTFTWLPSGNAESYTIEVSKDPTFATVEFSKNIVDTFFRYFKTFDKKSIYYWRVKAINECAQGNWTDVKSFGTLTLDCKKYSAVGLPTNISATGSPSIDSKINVPTGSNISDVNVSKLKISHTNFQDLTGTLVAPSGKRVILWEKVCPKNMNIEVLIDDQAPNPFSCVNTASGQYKSKEKLEAYNGQDATGSWTLEIKDGTSGNGGKLDAFELEICAFVQVETPVLVKDSPLSILPTDIGTITNTLLLAEDKNNTAAELTFVVTKLPTLGAIKLNGNTLAIGSTFTQEDINNNKITYVYTSNVTLPANDAFNYLVRDNEGGWFGINTFNIIIQSTTATNDAIDQSLINVYPNPSAGLFNIELNGNAANFNKVKVFNTLGSLISNQQILGRNASIDLSNVNAGLYFMEFTNGIERVVKKVMVSK